MAEVDVVNLLQGVVSWFSVVGVDLRSEDLDDLVTLSAPASIGHC